MKSHSEPDRFGDLSDAVYQFYRRDGLDKTILALSAVLFALQEMHNMEAADPQLRLVNTDE